MSSGAGMNGRLPIERPDVRPSPVGPILVGTIVEDWYCADCHSVYPVSVARCPCWPPAGRRVLKEEEERNG